MHEVKKFFKPEFLNRLDDIIVFHYLETENVKQIAYLFINELSMRMKEHDIEIELDDGVIEKLAKDGFEPVYGARPLRREVERQVENPLAMKIVRGECPPGSKVAITVENHDVIFKIS